MWLSYSQLTQVQPALDCESITSITIAIFPPACTSRSSAHNESLLTSDQAYSAGRALKAILVHPSTLHISCKRHLSRPFTDRELLSGLWFVSNTMAFQILALPSTRWALNIASLLSEGVEKKMDL